MKKALSFAATLLAILLVLKLTGLVAAQLGCLGTVLVILAAVYLLRRLAE